MDKQAEIDKIMREYAAKNREIEKDHFKNMARIGLGTVLSGASAHPVFNIPYIGTGIGGAMYDLGQGIVEGDKINDLVKRAARGFAIGETAGAIPYVGKLAGKTKAGQAIGKQFDKVAQKVAANPAVQKAYDVLTTDIKAFNPNKQTVYHGSPADFNKFSNEFVGTGEGAQAHGMGHYAALDKDVADKRYRKRLTTSSKEEVEIDNKYKPLFDEAEKKYDDYINNLYKQKQDGKITEEVYQNAIDNSKEAVEVDNILSSWQKEVAALKGKKLTPNEGQLYKLSIPKDDVMLREDLPLSQQPIKVQEVLRDYFNQNPLQKHERRFFEDIENPDLLETTTGGNLYRQIARNVLRPDKNMKQREANAIATQILQDKGIKGISYNGGIDGESRVIFNPDDIEIVRKYYNQPSLKDLYSKFINAGAYTSAATNP